MDQIVTQNQRFTCSECGNEVVVAADKKVGDFFECEFCGIEFEVAAVNDGEFTVKVVEEEK